MKRIILYEIVNKNTGEIVYMGENEKIARRQFRIWNKNHQYILRKGMGWRE